MTGSLLTALIGSWKLASVEFKMSDNGEIILEYLTGFCTFDANGRWTAVTVPSGRKAPITDQERAELFNRLIAFSGRCRQDGAGIMIKIDVAWNPAFIGAEIYRAIDLQGDRLTVTQPEWEHPFFPGRKTVVTVNWDREPTGK